MMEGAADTGSEAIASPNTESRGFNDNYRILAEAAERLRNQSEPDIDGLVPVVDRALTAYGHCKQRIADVRAMLAERGVDPKSEGKDEPAADS